MNRDRQQKEQLVKKFEEILPFLKTQKTFGWYIPECQADPVYRVHPDTSKPEEIAFKSVDINVQTGWHGEFIYRDDKGTHRIEEGVTPVKDEWSNYCYLSCCNGQARIS